MDVALKNQEYGITYFAECCRLSLKCQNSNHTGDQMTGLGHTSQSQKITHRITSSMLQYHPSSICIMKGLQNMSWTFSLKGLRMCRIHIKGESIFA